MRRTFSAHFFFNLKEAADFDFLYVANLAISFYYPENMIMTSGRS